MNSVSWISEEITHEITLSYGCLCVSVDTRECESQRITHGILVCAALL